MGFNIDKFVQDAQLSEAKMTPFPAVSLKQAADSIGLGKGGSLTKMFNTVAKVFSVGFKRAQESYIGRKIGEGLDLADRLGQEKFAQDARDFKKANPHLNPKP